MLERLIDYPVALAASIMAVSGMNYALWSLSLREASGQRHVQTSPSIMRPLAKRAELAQHLGLPIAVALLTLSGGRSLSQLLAGYLILQIATLILNIDAWLRWRILRIPGIVEGHLIATAGYQYRTLAARIIPLALFSGVVAAFFGSVTFAFGSLLLFATAFGWYRRARQSRSQPMIA